MKTQISGRIIDRAKGPIAPVTVLCGALAFLAGCAVEPESHVVSAPPPPAPTTTAIGASTTPMVTATPIGGTGQSAIVVTQAPPALVTEVVVARPTSQHEWVPGYWTWRNNRYEWMAGHWEVPPRTGAVWVAPRWEREGSAYRFYEGYWR